MRKLLGLLAVAGMFVFAAPGQRAEAALAAPGSASVLQTAPALATTEVQYRRGYGMRRSYGPRRGYAPRRYFAPPRVYAPRYQSRRYRY